jgi:hypothetical protein
VAFPIIGRVRVVRFPSSPNDDLSALTDDLLAPATPLRGLMAERSVDRLLRELGLRLWWVIAPAYFVVQRKIHLDRTRFF